MQYRGPYAATGLTPMTVVATPGQAIPGVERSAGPSMLETFKPWHPDDPLFWFGAILLATAGFIAASTQIRVGPVKVGAKVGK